MTPEQAAELIEAIANLRPTLSVACGCITGAIVYAALTISRALKK